MPLREYRRKRDFKTTPEPTGGSHRKGTGPRFVVQKHDASRLHYDFRLELDGVLKSWAVPKGPSTDSKVKSLAVEVEDHPLDYADFEGTIPAGQYGGGTVMVWDRGTWTPEGDPHRGLQQGKLTFGLDGEKLHGRWTLVRMAGRDRDKKNWLLIKRSDDDAPVKPRASHKEAGRDRSVTSGRTMDEIAAAADRVWHSNKAAAPKQSSSRPRRRRSRPVKLNKAELPGARKTPLPARLAPQLATLVAEVPAGNEWLHELKYDGYRILARINGEQIDLLTRRGNNWSQRFPSAVQALAELNLGAAILDGEIVALDEHGATDFQRLQNWLQLGNDKSLVYYVFDAPYLGGFDLMRTPLARRKAALEKVLKAGGRKDDGLIRYSDHLAGQGGQIAEYACQAGLEGVVSKRADSPYVSGRTGSWVKFKCLQRQEFLIGGYTQPSGRRNGFGSLLLGYYQQGKLRYAGHVGTGFTQQSLAELTKRLQPLRTGRPAFEKPLHSTARQRATWVRPELVAEVEFSEWTEDGMLRHPSFKGLREDKPAAQTGQEQAAREPAAKKSRKREAPASNGDPSGQVAGVALSHPDRVYYPELKLTKVDLARFYESIAEWVLPHLVNRPLTMLRCPDGRTGQCFFQKHLAEKLPAALRTVDVREKTATRKYVVIDDLSGLIALVQRGVLELHPWGAPADDLEHPDRLVIDLDPGEGAPWKAVIEAAREVRDYLAALELKSFVRTTGGKGLHVVVPLIAEASWDEHKEFAAALAQTLATRSPKKYLATMSKAERKGRVFIDYLRNQRGSTSIASYSTRTREQATVATPLRWTELSPRLRPERFNVQTLPKRLATRSDPWSDFFEVRQRLTQQVLNAARQVLAEIGKTTSGG